MEVNIHHAKTHLSKLIAAAENGEEVIIARAGKPAVKLVLITPPARPDRSTLRGSGIGKIWMSDDAFSPETDLEIQRLFEGDDNMLDGVGESWSTPTPSSGNSSTTTEAPAKPSKS